jgi:hypothetical protein
MPKDSESTQMLVRPFNIEGFTGGSTIDPRHLKISANTHFGVDIGYRGWAADAYGDVG